MEMPISLSGGGTVTININRLSPLKRGNLIADGTEQTLLEFVDVGAVTGYVSLKEMLGGDTVIIRQYMRIEEGGSYEPYASETFTGFQANPTLYFTRKETDLGIKITLEQTAGVFKHFINDFLREV